MDDRFCRFCGERVRDIESLETHTALKRVRGAVFPPAGTAPRAPKRHSRRGRALVTRGILIVWITLAAALVLALGNGDLTLSHRHAPALAALLGIVAVWPAAIVIGLALCRAAAAGDRDAVDAERTAALWAEPDLHIPRASSEWAKRQRKRSAFTGTRGPTSPSASTTPRTGTRHSAHP